MEKSWKNNNTLLKEKSSKEKDFEKDLAIFDEICERWPLDCNITRDEIKYIIYNAGEGTGWYVDANLPKRRAVTVGELLEVLVPYLQKKYPECDLFDDITEE